MSRYKAVKVITAHGGAFVPYQAYRLAAVGPKGLQGAPERRGQLQSLYFDSTMAGEPPFLASSPSRVSFWRSASHPVWAGKLQGSGITKAGPAGPLSALLMHVLQICTTYSSKRLILIC